MKKWTALLLFLVILLGVCSGCSNQKKYIREKEKYNALIKEYGIAEGTSLADALILEPYSNKEEINAHFTKITSDTPQIASCFDVRDDHMLLVGVTGKDTAVITVYDKNGKFQYGFEEKLYGSFRVMWKGDNIAVYSLRGNCLYVINENGEILEFYHVVSNADNSVYDTKVLDAEIRTVGTSTYYMPSSTTIIRIDEDGTTTTIYDASADRQSRNLKILLYFLIVSPFLAIGCIKGTQRTIEKINLEKMKKSK